MNPRIVSCQRFLFHKAVLVCLLIFGAPFWLQSQVNEIQLNHKTVDFVGNCEVYTVGFAKRWVITGNGLPRYRLGASLLNNGPELDVFVAKGAYFRYCGHNYLVTEVYQEGSGRSTQGFVTLREVYPLPENIHLLNDPKKEAARRRKQKTPTNGHPQRDPGQGL
jgi:hypothetical protein